jgi:adenylylsulfate kinase-like enzyme
MPQSKGVVVLFTGLNGSGKSALTRAVSSRLRHLGWSVDVIDGERPCPAVPPSMQPACFISEWLL